MKYNDQIHSVFQLESILFLLDTDCILQTKSWFFKLSIYDYQNLEKNNKL